MAGRRGPEAGPTAGPSPWLLVLLLLLGGVTGGVASPGFLEEPSNRSAGLGEEAELRCVVGPGGGAVQWAKDGLLLGAPPTAAFPRYRLAGDPRRGEHHLRIAGVTLEDDGAFECQLGAANGTGPRASRPALLTVLVPPGRPVLALPPGGPTWVAGTPQEVRCQAGDGRPPPRVALSLGGLPLPAVSSRLLDGSRPKLSSAEASVRLTLQPPDHGKQLVCSATNEAGRDPPEAAVAVSVLFPPEAPTIEGLEGPRVRAGATLRLDCIARGGNPPASLHWDKDGVPLAGSWVSGGGPGGSRSRLTLQVTPGDDGATLGCRAETPAAPGGVRSAVTLRVDYPPAEVTIAGGPAVAENRTLALSCTSAPSNPPARLRWWLGGRELGPAETTQSQAAAGGWVTVSNVTVTGRRSDHGRPLLCQALSPGLGPGPSASLVLSVAHPPQELWLEAPGPNVTFRVGTRVRLVCHARGGHPGPRLAWHKDGRLLKEGAQVSGGAVVTRELLVTVAPSDNGATYRCDAITEPKGAPLSASTRLRVLFPPLSVTITAAPREVRRGQTLVLTCVAGSAHPAPHITWHRQGHALEAKALPSSKGDFGGVTAASRVWLRVGPADQGQRVTCAATSPGLGVTVSAAHCLAVRHAPEFEVGPGVRVVARELEGARLPLAVVAHPPVETCAWSRAGRPLRPEGSPRHHLAEGGALDIDNVTRGDAGTYGVECRNAEGVASTHVLLLVHYPPAIRRLPDPVVVDEGGSVELLCEAEGSPMPPGSLQWGRLAEASQGPGPGGLPGELLPEEEGPVGRLRVRGARRDLGGPYECRVDTGVPPPARATVRLIVRYAPELEVAPEPEWVPVPDGSDTAELRCRAQGVPGVQLRWERDGRPLGASESRYQEQQWREGPWTRSVLTVANVSLERAQSRALGRGRNRTLGTFVCVAQNPLGTARRRLQLQLADRPDAPGGLRVLAATPTSLSLAWRPGFDGGLPQSFLVSVSGPGAPPPPAALLAPAPPVTLGGLRPATPYDVSVRARNARGDSPAAAIAAVTAELPQEPPAPPGEEPPPPPPGRGRGPGCLGPF
ncbi:nephrin [Struthio camelus]|uniref:nephrin n=1 Tax=Struthio camelus TaxID=8801 RepID=UPI003603AFF6